MARIRTIKPEFWTSEQVTDCDLGARLLFIGLWNFSDDDGRHVASIRRVEMEVFPGDSFGMEKIGEWIQQLKDVGLIFEYAVAGQMIWQVTGWHNQRINRHTPSRLPAPSEESLATIIVQHPAITVAPPAPPARIESNGEKKEKKKAELKDPTDFELARIWNEKATQHPEIACVRGVSPGRATKMRVRLNDPQFLSRFKEAMEHLPVANNPRFTWQPNFDWFLENEGNILKVVEGQYDKAPSTKEGTSIEEMAAVARRQNETQ